jgi:hypothetical protein
MWFLIPLFMLNAVKLTDVRPFPVDRHSFGTVPQSFVPLFNLPQDRPLGTSLHCQVRMMRSSLSQFPLFDESILRDESLIVEIVHDGTDVNVSSGAPKPASYGRLKTSHPLRVVVGVISTILDESVPSSKPVLLG